MRRIVVVPGLGLGPESWRPTFAALTPSLPVEVAPLPGYGVRAAAHTDLRPVALAEQLLSTAGVRDGATLLVGHSASCQVVAHAASLRPDLITGLLLVGPTTDPRARSWPRLAARWLATAASERPGQVPALMRQYHRTTLQTMWRAMDAARHHHIQRALSAVRCPVVVLRGRHDRICPADWAGTLGRTITLPAGAHMVPQTHGPLTAAVLADVTAAISG